MYDNYYTKYEDAVDFINSKNAEQIADKLEVDIRFHRMTAEKWAYLSKAYIYLDEAKKAVNAAKNAIKLDKNYAYGYVRLAFAYAKQANKKETENAVRAAEKLCREDDWLLYSFFVCLFGYIEAAGSANFYLKKLKDFNLDSPEYYYALGFAYGSPDIKQYEKAVEYFEKAVDYKNYYDLIYKTMIDCGKMGDDEKAGVYLNKCLAYGETEELLERKIQLYLYKDNADEIIADIRRYYRLTSDKQQALIYLASAFKIKEDYRKSLKYLLFAERITQPSMFLYEKIAAAYERLQDYKCAILYYKEALKFDRTDQEDLLNISYCYSRLKEHELASLYVDKVILLNPEDAYPYYRKGNNFCDFEEYEKAAEMYVRAVEIEPTDVDYYGSASYAYSKCGKIELSLEYANRGIMVDNNNDYIHFRKGWALQELGKYKEAIQSFEKCVECNSSYVDGYANISYCYSKIGEMKKSMLYANKALMVNKDFAYAHYRKAWGLHLLGKFEEAKESYEYALKLDPTDTFSYIGLSAANINMNDSADALKAANMAIFLDRNCGEAYYFKGLALSNLGKAKDAEKCYSMAKKLGYT